MWVVSRQERDCRTWREIELPKRWEWVWGFIRQVILDCFVNFLPIVHHNLQGIHALVVFCWCCHFARNWAAFPNCFALSTKHCWHWLMVPVAAWCLLLLTILLDAEVAHRCSYWWPLFRILFFSGRRGSWVWFSDCQRMIYRLCGAWCRWWEGRWWFCCRGRSRYRIYWWLCRIFNQCCFSSTIFFFNMKLYLSIQSFIIYQMELWAAVGFKTKCQRAFTCYRTSIFGWSWSAMSFS